MTITRADVFAKARRRGEDTLQALISAVEYPYPWQGGMDAEVLSAENRASLIEVPFTGPFDRYAQIAISWLGDFPEPLPTSPPDTDIQQWCALAAGTESLSEWWSIPLMPQVLITTRPFRSVSAGLLVQEDDLGRSEAELYRIEPSDTDRVYEVDSAQAWCALVVEHPLDVTKSRQETWGDESRWLLPDWRTVAETFDVVHLTPTAYLEVAGQPLEVNGGSTMLAGWGPDESIWLREVSIDRSTAVSVSLTTTGWSSTDRH